MITNEMRRWIELIIYYFVFLPLEEPNVVEKTEGPFDGLLGKEEAGTLPEIVAK